MRIAQRLGVPFESVLCVAYSVKLALSLVVLSVFLRQLAASHAQCTGVLCVVSRQAWEEGGVLALLWLPVVASMCASGWHHGKAVGGL